MLSLPPTVRIFLCTQPADMRRSFDGLAGMVTNIIKDDPLSGHLFVFRNRRADRMKILYFDRDGLAIWYKRLEKGVYTFPKPEPGATRIEVKPADLAMILEGIDLASVRRTTRYQRPQPKDNATHTARA